MAFVLDASITACWAFQDEDHPDASLAFYRMRAEEAVVPCLWWFEVRNILVVNERRRRIAESDTAAFLLNLSRLRVRLDPLPEGDAVLRLARTHRLSVYDAAYLELAQREGLSLATLDAALRRAAAEAGVPLLSKGDTGEVARQGERKQPTAQAVWIGPGFRKAPAGAKDPFWSYGRALPGKWARIASCTFEDSRRPWSPKPAFPHAARFRAS